MAHKKCVICTEAILEEPGIPYKGRTAHQMCFNAAIKVLQRDKIEKVADAEKKKTGKPSKPKAELKSQVSEEEYQQKQGYYNYIRSIIKDTELNAKIYAVSEDLIKKFGFSFSSMHKTLIYLHEIMCKELTGDIVGIIPYYHSDAQAHYLGIDKVEKINRDVDTSSMYREKTIQIKPRKKIIKQIDINSIAKEGCG